VTSPLARAARALALAAALIVLCAPAALAAPPAGFQETTAFSGLSSPTVVRFASDGRVFVAEQNGRIKMWDNLFDPTATVVADLGPKVHNFWDRGLLGFALDPQFPTRPYLYASYAHDAAIGGTAPRWGDACPNPPGATGDGCVISGRLSKLTLSGDAVTNEQVLVEDWCQQYPSHSVGALAFGPDNALYMTAGDGASFNFADYGQDGSPLNPCGDPPGGVGGAMTIPSAEGGALRSQDLRTSGDPVNLDGSVIRVDPDTGAGLPNNPLAGSSDANARRIVGYGLRNPFRFTVRPGTNELWIGDVGWNTHEEINRIVNPVSGPTNFGWPCREAGDLLGTYRDLNICLGLESQPGAYTAPYFSYRHSDRVVSGESCPTGSSSIAGLAFYNGGSFPSSYDGALFFSDYSRRCIWVMFRGSGGLPDPSTRQTFNAGAAGPVDLAVGPGGDLFYADLSGGTIRRIRFISDNQPPVARATANRTSGSPPLDVTFDGSTSTDPDPGDTLIYEWDLDGDGAFDDSTSATPSRTYTATSTDVRLRVTDSRGVSDTSAPITITTTQNTAPQASIDSPAASLQWRPGQQVTFTGSATDAEDGALGAAALSWTLDLHHCAIDDASNCHVHRVQEWNGTASASFSAPDHEYPSHLELTLTARDSFGVTDVERLRLDPQTVQLSFASSPPGLQLSVGGVTSTTPFTRTVIKGSTNSISAPTPQSSGGQSVVFSSWSDGGARSHDIVAPDSNTTYTATYAPDPGSQVPGLVAALGFDELSGTSVTDSSGTGNNGTILGAARTVAGRFNGALSFDGVNDWVTIPDSPSLDLTGELTLEAWVRPTVAASGAWRTVLLKEQPGNLAYALYGNSDNARPSGYVFTGGSEQGLRGTAALAANTWTHLATTYGGGQLRLYVNGTQVASRALTGQIPTSADALRIGGNSVWPEWFQGQIDEVRVYNRALSAAQVQADMNAPVGAPPPPDTQAPSAPPSLTANGSLGQVALSWGASTDNVGVARYNVHRSTTDGFTPSAANRVAQVTGTTRTDTGLGAGTYYYRVIAEDAAGNLSTPSPQAQATVTADTTAPSVSITAPAAGATVSGVVAVNASSSDDVGVSGVQFRLDGQNLGAEDTSAPYSTSWDTTTASPGAHTLTAVARDAAGNTRTSTAVNVTVDNSVPAPTGLVAAYGFNELSGTSVTDSSGSGNAGTVLGATRTVAGRYGGALSFDGVNDWVTVADSASLDLTGAMTLEAWVRPTTSAPDWRTVLLKEQPGGLAYSLYAGSGSSGPSGYVFVGGNDRGTPAVGMLATDTWTHLAVTYGGGQLRLYVNGTQVATRAQTGNILASNGALRIGGNGVWPEWFQGQIDEVRVYNRALTAAQIGADLTTPVGP
jgi:glucose/arabinose dehydrogenase